MLLIGRSKFLTRHDQSEVLLRFRLWHVISMEFLRSFFRRHFTRKPVASRNVGCFPTLIYSETLLEEKSLAERKLCRHAVISIARLTSKHLSGDGIRTSLSFLQSTSIMPMDLCSRMPTACSCSLLYFSSDSEKKLTSKCNTNVAAAG